MKPYLDDDDDDMIRKYVENRLCFTLGRSFRQGLGMRWSFQDQRI